MAYHPRERRRQGHLQRGAPPAQLWLPSRREFLRVSAVGLTAASFGPALLGACGGDDEGGTSAVELSRPDNPVTLPRFDDIEPIADDLPIESGTLKVYNYQEYINPDLLAAFEAEYGTAVEVTTFTSMDEAVARLASGEVSFDVFFPTTDVVGKLVAGKLLRPLNYSYLPNFTNVWPAFQDPFYDKGAVYSVPYTLYTTGIGYRLDEITKLPEDYAIGYDILWDPANAGTVYVLEDDREVLGMALLRQGETDINTEAAALIESALDDVLELVDVVNVRIGAEAYTVLAEKRAYVHQCWSGDVINAQYYLPEGDDIANIGYWYPADTGGVIGSDMIAVLAGADRPVLAHRFIDYLLNEENALLNYGWLGYQPPQNGIDPDRVVADEYVPEHLASAVIRPEDFDNGYQLLQLSLAGEQRWDTAWSTFSAG